MHQSLSVFAKYITKLLLNSLSSPFLKTKAPSKYLGTETEKSPHTKVKNPLNLPVFKSSGSRRISVTE